MKRMKFYIMATCLGIMIGILIITGLYNIIFLNTNFFTYEGIVEAVLAPLVYLFFVRIETRPGNKLLTYIVLFMILLLAICAIGEKTNIFVKVINKIFFNNYIAFRQKHSQQNVRYCHVLGEIIRVPRI